MKLLHSRNGFSLVEVALAMGIMTFCLVPLMALMPVGLSSNQTAIEQTAAGNIATSIATANAAVARAVRMRAGE